MNSSELRQKYLDFFREKNHVIISGASLIPENDPTVLFTSAGMQPLVPYLLGAKHPSGTRLASAQKCIRTSDIDEVGDRNHHTLFEMMGNWSLGDYFKEEAINFSWEFLTSNKWLALDKNRLAVSVFAGDNNSPFDEEAYNIWLKIFKEESLPIARIARLPKENNWWEPGATGPCGPDSEIFYWTGDINNIPESFNDDNEYWVEIWNNVFMQYEKKEDGTYVLLQQKNVDTGLGLERVTTVLSDLDDNYKNDLFLPIIKKIEELSNLKYGENKEITKSMRIIADHLKAALFVIGDPHGVGPSNTDQGYVVRRLIRKALLEAKKINIDEKQSAWVAEISLVIINIYRDVYSDLVTKSEAIILEMEKEAQKFQKSLERGLIEFNKLANNDLSAASVFNLYQSYGFPLEITEELAREKNIKLDREGFFVELKKHQELSRTATAGKFKGGLADSGEETVKLHTAAHLLLAALRKVLGDHVTQKGSNITAERLRFDFSHPEKIQAEQILEIEALVNTAINGNFDVVCENLSLAEAKEKGAMGVFDSKYGEMVSVYSVCRFKDEENKITQEVFSREICGGPHVKNTGILGNFKIIKEEASSAGVRRIKAILEEK